MDENVSVPDKPFDPMCGKYAWQMTSYDHMLYETEEEFFAATPEELVEARNTYVIENEGTYNRMNGHFLCDQCYIEAGMPSATNGWVCP